MPSRDIPFINEEYYHVFNRGVAHMPIFNGRRDYQRFIELFQYYQIEGPKPRFSFFVPEKHIISTDKKITRIICFCLMPNHFHFLLQQVRSGGITEFVSKISNSYTKYFNIKNNRVGPLLQGEFKSVYIETNEQLIHVSRYIHLNPLVGYLTNDLQKYKWSSFNEYIHKQSINICDKEIILNQFMSADTYHQFVLDQESYGKELEYMKHLLLDFPQV